jgi:hypothetical protein
MVRHLLWGGQIVVDQGVRRHPPGRVICSPRSARVATLTKIA